MIYSLKIGCKGTNFYLPMQIFLTKKHALLHMSYAFVQHFACYFTIFRVLKDNFHETLRNDQEFF